ncbi:hypothetical protein PUMCH_001579 [Australozyma saopauloensis]|uniref:Peroxisome assembly protein 22 n=1 Tax=Australozyma saopauloensis TaxID=291208 RepID=A0AAX4H6V8_9ASCO|nr:hypothetical protein PUMCH_001579 [[Candida] saopauloensis]
MSRRRSPKYVAAALVATSVAALGYKLYSILTSEEEETERQVENPAISGAGKKSIAVTLLHSVLSSDLPLNDILLSSENVTFILPPHLSVDDLLGQIQGEQEGETHAYVLPQTLLRNYKLLKCSNIQGYFHLLKNLKPDLLYVCSDDLGISRLVPQDLNRFVKEIVTLDQNKNSVQSVLSKVFIR